MISPNQHIPFGAPAEATKSPFGGYAVGFHADFHDLIIEGVRRLDVASPVCHLMVAVDNIDSTPIDEVPSDIETIRIVEGSIRNMMLGHHTSVDTYDGMRAHVTFGENPLSITSAPNRVQERLFRDLHFAVPKPPIIMTWSLSDRTQDTQ